MIAGMQRSGMRRWRAWLGRLALGLGVMATLLPARAQPQRAAADAGLRIAAVVEDRVVTVRDLDARLRLVLFTGDLPDRPEVRARLLPQVLRSYIDEQLMLQEAERRGIRVDEAEVDRAFAAVAAQNRMTPERLAALLRENGVPLGTLRDQLRARLAWQRFVERELRPRVVVTREQIELELARRRAATPAVRELRLAEILLPVYRPRQEAEVAAEARRLVETLRAGADFGALAAQVSAAPSAADGGEVGWVRLDDLAEPVRRAVAGLAPGEVSDPVRLPDGFRIFRVLEVRTASGRDPAEEVVELAQIVFPLPPDASERERARALRRAEAVRPRLVSCPAAETLAAELRTPASGRLGWMRIDRLPPAFAEVVRTLDPGRPSPPLAGPLGIHLLLVCRRGGEEGLRELVRLELERRQLERLAARYLRDLRRDAYIDIRI